MRRSKLKQTIAVDFDGTLVEDKWPYIGEPNMKLIRWLKFKQACGWEITLWTCREGKVLDAAIDFLKSQCHFVPDWVNESSPERIKQFNNDPRKIYYDILIDDKSQCCRFKLPFKKSSPKQKVLDCFRKFYYNNK